MIDIHTHLHPERLGKAIRKWFADKSDWKLYHPFDPVSVADKLKEKGVSRFVFCSYAHKAGIAASINQWLCTTAKELDGYGLPLLTVHLDDPDFADYAKKAIANGCIGVKIHEDVQALAIDDPRFDSVYEQVAKINGFVLAHVGPIPWRIEEGSGLKRVKRVKEKFPKLNFVVAHMGLPDTLSYFKLAEQTPGLYLDTTMSFSTRSGLQSNIASSLLERHSDKILFGTDYPNIPYEYELEQMCLKKRGLSTDAQTRIFDTNARALLAPFI